MLIRKHIVILQYKNKIMAEVKKMAFFEKYLSLWVVLCIAAGIAIGSIFEDGMKWLAKLEIAGVNIPIAILVWAMIYPMMVQIDFSSIKNVKNNKKGLGLTLIVNWVIKPFSMALFAWIFFDKIYAAYLDPNLASEYIAGAILLGAAPCTAMVFVWSYLTNGDANYTLVQVSVNDLIILILFIPIVKLLLGITNLEIPYDTLIGSVVIFVVIPLVAGYLTNKQLIKNKGQKWLQEEFMPKLKPFSIIALLSTLVLIFSFQGKVILNNPLHIFMIAIPLSIQTYFIFFITWFMGRYLKLPHGICAPSAMIGASNFFELAVAVAIMVFGLESGVVVATVVGLLIEVPIMLHLVSLANKWKSKF